jgi:endonuclease/exonuclease/phosphatase family metal-dependent hydrolase
MPPGALGGDRGYTGAMMDEPPRRRPRWQRLLLWTTGVLAGLAVALAATVYTLTFHPDDVQAEPVSCQPAETLAPGQPLKVLSWNVQFMAGMGYHFFYDGGPDERPSAKAVTLTLAEVARVIRAERPDVVQLQEVDDGAARTDGEDQLARLLALLGDRYPCHASAFYWKASFVPHPNILGAAGMKLSTLSRFAMASATRRQLPQMPADPVTRQFQLKRAVLEVRLPVQGGGDLALLNTHLDAFAQGSDTMERQVAAVLTLIDGLTQAGTPWLLSGDFNLLPDAAARDRLRPEARPAYAEATELAPLSARYRSVPSREEAAGPDPARWYTHVPTDPAAQGQPDRTIDYVFLSDALPLGAHHVRQADTRDISDHLPVVVETQAPPR